MTISPIHSFTNSLQMILTNILIFIGTFLIMEGVAWGMHKYVMHGFLWNLHSDHHKKDHDHVLERNDWFFLFFATPSFFLLLFGVENSWADPRVWIGFGIMAYGFAYFIVHEIFIHQRIKMFTRTKNRYLRAIRKAHKIHHKHLGKEDGECFGMLWVPMKYFKESKAIR